MNYQDVNIYYTYYMSVYLFLIQIEVELSVRADKFLAPGSTINLLFLIINPVLQITFQQPVTLTVSITSQLFLGPSKPLLFKAQSFI